MPTNELSVVVTQEKNDAVHQLLDSILAELDFLRDLSVEDRKGLVKMGRKNLDFVERCYRHAEGSPQYLVSFMAIEEFKKDIDYFRWLRDVERKLDLVADKVKDTAMLAEAEAYKASRLYYNSVKAAAKAGDEEAELIARDLGIHYKKQGASKTEKPPAEQAQQ